MKQYVWIPIVYIFLSIGCSQFIVSDPPDNMDYALVITGPSVIEKGAFAELTVSIQSNQRIALPDIAWESSNSSALMVSPYGEFCTILGAQVANSIRVTATSLDGFGVSTDFWVDVVAPSGGTEPVPPSDPEDPADPSNEEPPAPEDPPARSYDSTAFVTTWEVPDGGIIFLPLNPDGIYDIVIDWGDTVASAGNNLFPERYLIASSLGVNFDTPVGPAISHQYERAGEYTVAITGTLDFTEWSFKDYPASKDFLTGIEQWGDATFSATSSAFYGCSQLADMPALDASIFGNDMSYLFYGASAFNGDISDWDVSKVKKMDYLFAGASSFNGDISGWDVSGVKNMNSMFEGATSFNGDLSTWDVGEVSTMKSMFEGASSFNGDISDWNVEKVLDMESMFEGATSFNRDISDWDITQVQNMSAMFAGATSFTNGVVSVAPPEGVSFKNPFVRIEEPLAGLAKWDISRVKSLDNMFFGASSFSHDLSSWQLMKNASIDTMFLGSAMTNIDYHPEGCSSSCGFDHDQDPILERKK